MDYLRFAISNPVKVTVAVLLVVLFGVLSLNWIPIQLVPNVEQPVVTVETDWTRGSPQEVENDIIKEQERTLNSISGLKKMTSICRQGGGEITLEFHLDVNLDRVVDEVSDKLRQVPDYPEDVDEPVISAVDIASNRPIAWMVLTSGDPDFDIESLRHDLQERVKPYLERIEGVARVNLFGGRDKQVEVRVDSQRLAQRHITAMQLRDALRRANVNVSGGDLPAGRVDVRIRSVGQYDNLQDIRRTIVADDAGGPVRVADICQVQMSLAKPTRLVRSRGQSAVALNAIRETGSNVVQVMARLKQRLVELNDPNEGMLKDLGPQLKIEQVYDETRYISDSIALVTNNLKFGGILAALILVLFLRDVRFRWLLAAGLILLAVSVAGLSLTSGAAQTAWSATLLTALGVVLLSAPATLIISIAIPVSIIGTFVIMTAFGRSLNVISLAGLAFAVGIVVDNAIVVLENIDRHLKMGKPAPTAAYDGAREVWGAVLASTLTTLAVFIPVLTIAEEAGQLFRDIALAICAAVTISLFISVTVIPTAGARWLRRTAPACAGRRTSGPGRRREQMTGHFAAFIERVLRPRPGLTLLRIAMVGGLTAAALAVAIQLAPPATYLPPGNRNLVIGMMMTPPAYSMEQNRLIASRVEASVSPFWATDGRIDDPTKLPDVRDRQGNPIHVPPIENFFFVVRRGTIFMGAASSDQQHVKGLETLLTNSMATTPGAFGFARQTSIFGRGLGGSNSVDIELTGNHLGELRRSADALYGALVARYGPFQVRKDPQNYDLPGPELQFRIDRVVAARLNIDVTDLGAWIQMLIDGVVVGDYNDGGQTIDLVLIRDATIPLEPETIGMVPIAYRKPDGTGGIVPLASIAQTRWADAPEQIRRVNENRAITLTVLSPENEALEKTMGDVEAIIAPLQRQARIRPGVQVDRGGTADKLTTVRAQMLGDWSGWNRPSLTNLLASRLFLSLLITYLLMAALFESFFYPLVIMFSVPLAAAGGVLGLVVVRHFDPSQQLDVLTMLGFIILIGIVVNNAILIVHQSLNFMHTGRTGPDAGRLADCKAIAEAVRTRMRPIMMTTTTSVVGMMPLILSRFVRFDGLDTSGSELYTGLGSVVVGGLLLATAFTLIIVPLSFSLLLDARRLIGRRWPVAQIGAAGSQAPS